uniref:Uncharacterized protein n=1 Tax=Ditylum brightwellii TaxID=49249 RepID=A0A7S4R665_9STRA
MNLSLVGVMLVAGSSVLSVHGTDGVTTTKTGLRGGNSPQRVLTEVHAASDFLEGGLPPLPSKQEDLFDNEVVVEPTVDEAEIELLQETMRDSIMDAANMEYLKYMEHDGEEIFDNMEEDEAGVE